MSRPPRRAPPRLLRRPRRDGGGRARPARRRAAAGCGPRSSAARRRRPPGRASRGRSSSSTRSEGAREPVPGVPDVEVVATRRRRLRILARRDQRRRRRRVAAAASGARAGRLEVRAGGRRAREGRCAPQPAVVRPRVPGARLAAASRDATDRVVARRRGPRAARRAGIPRRALGARDATRRRMRRSPASPSRLEQRHEPGRRGDGSGHDGLARLGADRGRPRWGSP